MFSSLPESVRPLAALMSEISERQICAGWYGELEYTIWGALQEQAAENNLISLSEIDRQRLRELVANCGHWVAYVEPRMEWCAIPLADWEVHFSDPLGHPLNVFSLMQTPENLGETMPLVSVILKSEVSASIKRLFLVTDKVVIAGLAEELSDPSELHFAYLKGDVVRYYSSGLRPYSSAEHQWLCDSNNTLVYEIATTATKQSGEEADLFRRLSLGLSRRADPSILKRLAASQLSRIYGAEVIPALQPDERFAGYRSDRKAVVLSILLRNLAVPGETVPYEDIHYFRRNPDNQQRLRMLRQWLSKAASGQATPSELQEEIRWLLFEHQRALESSRLKHVRGAFEAIVVTVAEVAEDLVKIKWGKLAKTLFSIRRNKGDLLTAERSSLGAHLAYVLHATKSFENP